MRIDHYDWSGGREAMLRFGPEAGPVAVVALPLFEEANRVRAFAVTLCRLLAKRGVASLLPDLPGQGESLHSLQECGIIDLTEGIGGASKADRDVGRTLYGVAIRSGAILDEFGPFDGRWYFSPQDGPSLLRELKRTKQASSPTGATLADVWYYDDTLPDDAPDPPVEVAGNLISPLLLTALNAYRPWQDDSHRLRTVRLDSDRAPAHRHVPGTPLWRRAEPDNDLTLADLLADDIAEWITRCEG